jgi:hypothetical protein
MSRYAWLVCMDCKVMVWLGKAAIKGDRVDYIHPRELHKMMRDKL